MFNSSLGRCVDQALSKLLLCWRPLFTKSLVRSISMPNRAPAMLWVQPTGSSEFVLMNRAQLPLNASTAWVLTNPSAFTTSTPFDLRSDAFEDSGLRVVPLRVKPLVLLCKREAMTLPPWEPVAPYTVIRRVVLIVKQRDVNGSSNVQS